MKRSLLAQKNYFKKQEFENHFFKLYDELRVELDKLHENKIFEEYQKQIDKEVIVDIQKFKDRIYKKENYPREFFNLLEFILTYVYENNKDAKYIFLIKNKLTTLDLLYVALDDMNKKNSKYSKILEELDIYEYLKYKDIPSWLILILNKYSAFKNKLVELHYD